MEGDVIVVDVKARHNTNKFGDKINSLQILTAYFTNNAVVLVQKSVDEKTNEIPVSQEMLELLEIEDKTITTDDLHCKNL